MFFIGWKKCFWCIWVVVVNRKDCKNMLAKYLSPYLLENLSMSWSKSDVATRFKDLIEECLFIHCYGHPFNIVYDAIRKVSTLNKTYSVRNQEDLFESWIRSMDKNLPRGNGDFQMYDWVNKRDKVLTVTLSCSLLNRYKPKCSVRMDENIWIK